LVHRVVVVGIGWPCKGAFEQPQISDSLDAKRPRRPARQIKSSEVEQ
jgi:hypothetical protein